MAENLTYFPKVFKLLRCKEEAGDIHSSIRRENALGLSTDRFAIAGLLCRVFRGGNTGNPGSLQALNMTKAAATRQTKPAA